MTEIDEELARMTAMADQLDAGNRERRRERLAAFERGPDPDDKQLKPIRLWQEGGIWCAIAAGPYGALNGYARLPDGHPWVGLDINDSAPGAELDFEQPAEQAMDDHGVLSVFAAAADPDEFAETLGARVPVHGGLTWTGPMPIAGAPHGWWLGFDTMHFGDKPNPELADPERRLAAELFAEPAHPGHVWTEDEVALEVKRMVTAIREAAP